MSQRSSSVALVQSLYERLTAGDLEAVQTRLSPHFILRAPDSLPYGGRREGPGALLQSMQAFLQHWKQPQFQVDQFAANDEGLVVAHIQLKVMSHAGVSFATEVIECWTVIDDLITSLDVYYLNPEATLRAIRGRHRQS